MQEVLSKAGVEIKNGKIEIPNIIKHIKLDIGLSYSAPQSQHWLANESNLLVFGFEPNPESIDCILSPLNKKKDITHADVIDTKYIQSKKLQIIPIALGNTETVLPFYITDVDPGCSSLFKPTDTFQQIRPIKSVIHVPVFKLSQFMELLPWNQIPFIDYIKIDAQGADLDIVKGGEQWISERVVYITLEAESNTYSGCQANTVSNINTYMNSIGFIFIRHPNTSDPTFVNSKFLEESKSITISQL
jgi:FkbM family methyltransferase